MALLQERKCRKCEQIKLVNVHSFNGFCDVCQAEIASAERRQHLGGLKELTPEERLQRIEEQLYDLNAEARISGLEAQNQRYA